MAKITRKFQRVFADDVAATNVIAQFGSAKAAAIEYSKDPDVIQELAAFGEGWSSATIQNAAALQDMNGLFFLITRQIAYLMQSGVAEWDADTVYYIGSLVSDSANPNIIFVSLANDNTNNALTDATKWLCLCSRKVTEIEGDYTALNSDWLIVFTDSVDTGEKVTLPAPAAGLTGREIIVKLMGSSFVSQLGITVSGGSTIDGSATIYISQYGVKRLVCDGTNWHVV